MEKIVNIPMDVCLDIFNVLLDNAMEFNVIGLKQEQNSIVIKIPRQGDPGIFRQGVENIEAILKDYESYLTGRPQE